MEAFNTLKLQAAVKKKVKEGYEENRDFNLNAKRSADFSPDLSHKKRSILCDITNEKIVVSKTNSKTHIRDAKASIGSWSEEDSLKKSLSNETLKTEEKQTAYDRYNAIIFKLPPVPLGVEDFDISCKHDPNSESLYAPFIFAYYKEREKDFIIEKYMSRQSEVTKGMRACLVDWLVEVQESFELNHETLYLSVKLVDFYLMKHKITKTILQLVGATSMLIASKYDERTPPVVDDFLYICDDSYSRAELLAMEESILKTVDFNLGIPISYRFLRRYARCARASMETLTLARYILETCLMDYELIDTVDSKMAAASFLLALRMKNLSNWTPTLEYYSGYLEKDLEDLVKICNNNISTVNKNLMTVRTKYSHPIFFEVAKIPPLKDCENDSSVYTT